MMHNFVQKRCELTNCYFFVLKSDKVLLFRIKNYDKSLLFTEKENKSLTDTVWGTPFYLPQKENDPRPDSDTKLLLSALIKA